MAVGRTGKRVRRQNKAGFRRQRENAINAEGRTQSEAWATPLRQAAALGMLAAPKPGDNDHGKNRIYRIGGHGYADGRERTTGTRQRLGNFAIRKQEAAAGLIRDDGPHVAALDCGQSSQPSTLRVSDKEGRANLVEQRRAGV